MRRESIVPLTLLALIVCVGCTTTITRETVQFEAGSIQNYPAFGTAPMTAQPIIDEEGKVIGFAATPTAPGDPVASAEDPASADPAASPAPRASGTTGMGDTVAEAGTGNIIISIGQNKGVEQTGGEADAAANVNSPNGANTRTVTDK